MINLLDKKEVSVVNDQISSPTSAIGIAACILNISKTIISKNEFNKWGTYHFQASYTALGLILLKRFLICFT